MPTPGQQALINPLGSTCILIPYPDDEALSGGLLALLREAKQPVTAVLVSDGSASYSNFVLFSAEARRAVHEGKLRHTLSTLGVDGEPLCPRLPDGAVPCAAGQPGFEAVVKLHNVLQRIQPQTLLLPWRRDPHPDHRASHALAQAALPRLPAPPRQLEYIVWAWERAAPSDKPEPTDNVREVRIDITAQRPTKLRAIAAHRSQIATGVFADDPGGLLLLPAMLARFAERPFELHYAPV